MVIMKVSKDFIDYIFLKLWHINIGKCNDELKTLNICSYCYRNFKTIEDKTKVSIDCNCCGQIFCSDRCFSIQTHDHYW